MIDYCIVIYKNYGLGSLQEMNFKRRFNKKDYRLIIVDNTPDDLKIDFKYDPKIVDKFIPIKSTPTFDGISHGNALNEGLKHCETDIVSILDSDFFLLNNNIHDYVHSKFNQGYQAVGCEFNDGTDASERWRNLNPKNFENIPCCFGAYYKRELATADSWIITNDEVQQNMSTGFVEVGYRIRKHILDNNIKTLAWNTTISKPCYFRNEDQVVMGMHYVAGSHVRASHRDLQEIYNLIIKDSYV